MEIIWPHNLLESEDVSITMYKQEKSWKEIYFISLMEELEGLSEKKVVCLFRATQGHRITGLHADSTPLTLSFSSPPLACLFRAKFTIELLNVSLPHCMQATQGSMHF